MARIHLKKLQIWSIGFIFTCHLVYDQLRYIDVCYLSVSIILCRKFLTDALYRHELPVSNIV